MKPEVSNADVCCAVRSCKAANCDSRRSTVLRCSLHTTFLAFEQFFSERSNSQRRTNVHCTGQLHDRPLAAADLQLDEPSLRQKRLRWLNRHDQETSHLASLLPLVVGLPVRLTEKVDKKLRLFKGKRGHISSWTLAEGTVVTACNSGFVLSKQPLGIYVNFPGETWQVAPSLPRGTYLFTPATRNWLLCRRSGMSALRTGYFLVPDFATTAHMAQGQSLPALFCCIDTDPVAAYVMLSRTTALETLAILRPFSSRLFRGGPPLGRQLLLRKFLEADKIHNTNNFGDCRNVCPTSGFDSRNS